MPRIEVAVARALSAALIASAACTTTGGGGPESPPASPREVRLDPASGPAGSIVKVRGLDIDGCPLRTSEILVAGQTAPAVLNDRREVLMRLPLFYDEGTQWAAPPAGPQDVEVFCNGELWTELPGAVTVTDLPTAPGTTRSLVADYQQIVADYRALVMALSDTPGVQQQVFTALFAGVEELVAGTSDESLPAVLAELEAEEPEVLALVDGMLAVGSVDEAVSELRDRMQGMSTSAALSGTPTAPAALDRKARKSAFFDVDTPILLSDTELASALSLYGGLVAFSKDFVGETASEFGTTAGIITIVIKSKLATALATTLTLLDYVMNKVVVSALPSKLDSIHLEILETRLDNSETTSSEIWLRASNDPEPMKISDIASVLTTTLGIAAGGAGSGNRAISWINNWEEIAPNLVTTIVGLMKDAFRKYADENTEGFEFDLETVAIVPGMKFEALGVTRALYLLKPDRSNVVHPTAEELQWRASDTYWGSAEVYVVPSPEAFGPYGDTWSNQVRVEVGELTLLLDRYLVIVPEGASTELGVKLSSAPEDGMTVFARQESGDPDIEISEGELYFDESNWDEYQMFTVTAADDTDQEDGESTLAAWTNVDPDAGTFAEATIVAIEADDDRPHFVLEPPSVRVYEGTSTEVGVRLSHAPSSRVTAAVTYSSGDPDLFVESPTIMWFDQDDWDEYQDVTIYARPDEDMRQGKTQFSVSAHTPAGIEDSYITATEDEDGSALSIFYKDWNANQRTVVGGTVQIELDPDNFDLPLQRHGTLAAYFTSDYAGNYGGTAYVTVFNHPMEPACPCGPPTCYERQTPDDVILRIEGRINWRCAPGNCADFFFYMTVPLVADETNVPQPGPEAAFRTACIGSSFGSYYSVTLEP